MLLTSEFAILLYFWWYHSLGRAGNAHPLPPTQTREGICHDSFSALTHVQMVMIIVMTISVALASLQGHNQSTFEHQGTVYPPHTREQSVLR